MSYPTPDAPIANQPIWENYVTVQTGAACLGRIPRHAVAIRVGIDGRDAQLRFQLSKLTKRDTEDMVDIADELAILGGGEINVTHVHEVAARPRIGPDEIGLRTIYVARSRWWDR